jgi:hypothetical protein
MGWPDDPLNNSYPYTYGSITITNNAKTGIKKYFPSFKYSKKTQKIA